MELNWTQCNSTKLNTTIATQLDETQCNSKELNTTQCNLTQPNATQSNSMQLTKLNATQATCLSRLTSLPVLYPVRQLIFRIPREKKTAYTTILRTLLFSLKSNLLLWLVVFDELDVFNGPCQTVILVAYLDWHMDLGYLVDDLLPICLKGTAGSVWPSSVWYIYRQQTKCEKLYWLFWKGYIREFTQF